jgi:WbqC-like protein family
MKVGIMQPTYLPWLGYFEMISNVDLFILLDNVQFEKKSWQHRNRIRNSNGALLLTVPIQTSKKSLQLISDVQIAKDASFPRKHIESIRQSYLKTNYFDEIFPDFRIALESEISSIALLNETLIRIICEHLGISTKIVRASELNAVGRGTSLTVAQCLEVGADTFYAARGSEPYVSKEEAFSKNGISVIFQNYVHPVYEQIHGGFIESLSAIDLLFNCGLNSLNIFRGYTSMQNETAN